jgi:hypothetical protein
MTAPGRFNFSRAVREWAFVQLPLVELGALRKEASRRGLDDLGLVANDPWETLDREGLFVPVAYARHGMWHFDQPACLADGDLQIREESGYVPWAQFRREAEQIHGDDARPLVLYHHWQLLWLGELQSALARGTVWGNLGEGLETFYAVNSGAGLSRSWRRRLVEIFRPVRPPAPPRDGLRDAAATARATELLLVRVQNVFFPFERGGPRESSWTGSQINGLTDDAIEWSMDQLQTLDYAALAVECGVDADDLAATYEKLIRRALWIDPNAQLLDLMDQIRRSHRERLKGAALRAVDFYDAARVIRFWHEAITGTWLPDIDEHFGWNGTEFKQRRFGTTVNVRGNRALIPILLEDYGLYPWRVQLIGEGDSEIEALRLIVEEHYGLSFDSLGVAVTDMGGSEIPANAERLLAAMRGYVNYFLLVFDDEGRAREMIETLVRVNTIEGISDAQRAAITSEAAKAAKQLDDREARGEAMQEARERAKRLDGEPGASPEFVLWEENLEASNFTLAELSEVINRFATEEIGLADFSLTEAEIDEALKAEGQTKAVASVILESAEEKHAGFRLSKPEFARRLAKYALDHPEIDGKERRILTLAEHLIQLTWADRRLAGRLRQG